MERVNRCQGRTQAAACLPHKVELQGKAFFKKLFKYSSPTPCFDNWKIYVFDLLLDGNCIYTTGLTGLCASYKWHSTKRQGQLRLTLVSVLSISGAGIDSALPRGGRGTFLTTELEVSEDTVKGRQGHRQNRTQEVHCRARGKIRGKGQRLAWEGEGPGR